MWRIWRIFVPEELPDNKYYIFGKEGAQNLAKDLGIPVLGEIPLIQGIREAGDTGKPAALNEGTKNIRNLYRNYQKYDRKPYRKK